VRGGVFSGGRRDANEPKIRRVVEEVGGSFVPHSGRDEPDAFVGFAGLTEPWEIKDGNKRLKPGQKRWAERWKGRPSQIVRNEAQARKALRMMALDAGVPMPCNWEDAVEQEEARRSDTAGKDTEQPA
jgi:hypothetical protein